MCPSAQGCDRCGASRGEGGEAQAASVDPQDWATSGKGFHRHPDGPGDQAAAFRRSAKCGAAEGVSLMGLLTTWWKPLSAGALAVVLAGAVAGCAGTATASDRPPIPAPARVAPAPPAPAPREGADPSPAAPAVDPPGGAPRPAAAPRPDPRVLATVR